MSQRARAALGGAAIACLLGACTGASDDPGGPTAASIGEGRRATAPLSLLYVDGTDLRRLDISSGRERSVTRMATADAHAAAGSRWIATVEDARPAEGEEDFAAEPVLRLLDPFSGTERNLGPGFSPLWDPEGRRVAWLRPVEPRACAGEVCTGKVEVVALETATMSAEVLLSAGRWGLLSWAGDRLLLSRGEDHTGTTAVSLEGERSELPVPPAEIWGASADGRVLVRVGRRASLVRLEDGRPAERVLALAGGSRALAEGSWSPDDSTLAVVELSGGGLVPSARLLLVSPEDGSVRPLEGSRGATGAVLWSPDGESVAFARPSGPGRRRLEAVLCPLAGGDDCRRLLDWREGVVLLRLEERER